MKSSKLAMFGIAAVALVGAGCAHTTAPSSGMKMSAADEMMMGSCMSMSHDDMMKNAGCTGMMKKMNMTESEMQKMMSCKKMSPDAMMKDQDCTSMMKMHPDMMKMSMPR
jgi:hypothetical protein